MQASPHSTRGAKALPAPVVAPSTVASPLLGRDQGATLQSLLQPAGLLLHAAAEAGMGSALSGARPSRLQYSTTLADAQVPTMPAPHALHFSGMQALR
jgi:hypothetical protein